MEQISKRIGDETRTFRPDKVAKFADYGLLMPALVLVSIWNLSCALKANRQGLPADVEAVIGTVSADIAAEHYEKIYNEAAEQWRQDATLEQSNEVFKTLRTKLGKPESRVFHSATEQHQTGGKLSGHSFLVTYQTKFERGEAMETFTLVKPDDHWMLARYFVNSTALK
jgi:uncharacterized protein DUF4019